MKKKLEADLISIAHKILQMKNKSDVNLLYNETQKLYEKLSVLRFVEEHFGDAKPTIGQAGMIEKVEQIFEEIPLLEIEPVPVVEALVIQEDFLPIAEGEEGIPENETISLLEVEVDKMEEQIVADEHEISKKETNIESNTFPPVFELGDKTNSDQEIPKKAEAITISFEELLGGNYADPLFVKLDRKEELPKSIFDFELPKQIESIELSKSENFVQTEAKTTSVLDKKLKFISIGLNDRIAFVKQLFGNSEEDYNRVLNQLITYDSFGEAQNFINEMVKPDYKNWEGKEDYEQRFIEIIEKKFA